MEDEKELSTVGDDADEVDTEMISAETDSDDVDADDEDAFESLYEDDEPEEPGDNEEQEAEEGQDSDEGKNGTKNDASERDAQAEYRENLEASVKHALKALGCDDVSDPIGTLQRVAAEASGLSVEEYKNKLAAQLAFDKQVEADMAAIHAAYPETKQYKHYSDFPNGKDFARAMDSRFGFSAVEAFERTHPNFVAKKNSGKSSDLAGTKSHLTSSVPKGAKDTSTYISKAEMASLRETFGDKLSDAEIKALYKKVSK